MTGKHQGIRSGGRHRLSVLVGVTVLGLAIVSAITLTQPTNHRTPTAPSSGATSSASTASTGNSDPASAIPAASQPWLRPVGRQVVGHLRPGSNPSVLPSSLLIVDKFNNRLIVVDPQGRIRWQFPQAGDLAAGQTFRIPDDAFFTPDGRYLIATQEDQAVITLIDIAKHRIVYRYGVPGHPGMTANHLSNPDDAIVLPDGYILSADIKNCRLVLIAPGAHTPAHVIGRTTTACLHDPPRRWGSPNGIFPMSNGHYLVTEINGNWVDSIGLDGTIYWTTHPPGVSYPSDTNQIGPDRVLTVDYATPGKVVIFDHTGRKIWSYRGTGSNTLNHPSLALPLPNGDVVLNDDYNHRVIVIDPHTNTIVWQYGTTGVAGSRPGYLNNPDGLDLVPPKSLLSTHSTTLALWPTAPTK